ncbi:MAG: hypothetical protein ACFFCI_17885 [Promethearchaeota archaeon]
MCDNFICRNNDNGECRLDWGCCFDPDPEILSYIKKLGEIFGDD